ncbi:hypothetical protein ANANG_G00048050 [Anguilla anguilla]|uniref:Uncharacterized protein n=1 Tax=Anguilla anguilla TaxID=7936 RepID=A0A9D3MYG0_ANGAN|nr:hypothetical protein ANANG_G00048050 [Anguilla anguilla]
MRGHRYSRCPRRLPPPPCLRHGTSPPRAEPSNPLNRTCTGIARDLCRLVLSVTDPLLKTRPAERREREQPEDGEGRPASGTGSRQKRRAPGDKRKAVFRAAHRRGRSSVRKTNGPPAKVRPLPRRRQI